MDKAERKRLKNEAKLILAKRDKDFNEALELANSVPTWHPIWPESFKDKTLRERELRHNPPDYISKQDVDLQWVTLTMVNAISADHSSAYTQYYECLSCKDLIHSCSRHSVSCQCGAIMMNPGSRKLSAPPGQTIRLVKLFAKVKRKSLLVWFFERYVRRMKKSKKTYESNEDFFQAFEDLVQRIDGLGQREVAKRLRDGFSCLNGLTDGWALLMESIETTMTQDRDKLQSEDMAELESMLKLVQSLNSRAVPVVELKG